MRQSTASRRSPLRGGTRARFGLGVAILALAPLRILASCDAEGPREKPGVRDAEAADRHVFGDAASTDADEEPGPLVSCTSTFAVSADCVHPEVTKDCDARWCRIPKGCSVMGAPPCEFGRGAYDEGEVQVRLTHDFEIAAHETTQAEWQAVGFVNRSVTDASYADCASADCPVGNLTWFDALAYANRLSETHQPPLPACYRFVGCTGLPGDGLVCAGAEPTAPTVYECRGYRLPTEAEWEYASRAGTRTPIYSGPMVSHPYFHCTDDPNLAAIAWYCHNAGNTTHPVERLAANGWGLHDMMRNADEWVTDVFNGLGYEADAGVDPDYDLADGGPDRVKRGGPFVIPSEGCRAAHRATERWSVRGPGLGFRLARTLP